MPKIPQHAASGKARKPREMTWDAIDSMLEAGCSGQEIAAFYGWNEDKLYTACKDDKGLGFQEYKEQKRASGKSLLRHKMFSQAMSGDKTLQIWLSKQILDMRDIPKEADADQDTDVVIVFEREDNEAE